MKKVLMYGIPVVIAVLLVIGYAAPTFGFGRFHRHHDARDFIAYKFDKMSKELNLTPAQQIKVDAFKKELNTLIDERHAKHQEIHRLVSAELSRDNPDIRKITPLIDQQIDQAALTAHDIVGRVAELFEDLTPEQKKLLTNHILERMQEED